jgi:hypothetical protein
MGGERGVKGRAPQHSNTSAISHDSSSLASQLLGGAVDQPRFGTAHLHRPSSVRRQPTSVIAAWGGGNARGRRASVRPSAVTAALRYLMYAPWPAARALRILSEMTASSSSVLQHQVLTVYKDRQLSFADRHCAINRLPICPADSPRPDSGLGGIRATRPRSAMQRFFNDPYVTDLRQKPRSSRTSLSIRRTSRAGPGRTGSRLTGTSRCIRAEAKRRIHTRTGRAYE